MLLDIFTPKTYLIIVFLCLTIDVPLTVRHLKYSRTISTGWDFVSRKKITSAMSKSKKSTRCCPAKTRVVASSHTSVNHVEPKKQSTLDAIVASARIVARITQINGLQFTSPCTRDRRWIRQTRQVRTPKNHPFQGYAKNMAISGTYPVQSGTSKE